MSRITASLSSRVDRTGKSEILLRFVSGRDHIFRLHSRLYISPSRWKDGAVVVPRLATPEQQDLKALKGRLDDLCDFLTEQFEEADCMIVTKEWMQETVDRFHHPERNRDAGEFFPLLREFINTKDVSLARWKRYEVTRRALERFQIVRGESLTVEGMTPAVLEEFRQFLITEHELAGRKEWKELYSGMDAKELPKERGKNAIIEYFDVIRTFYHWLNSHEITDTNPFKRFEVGTAIYGTPYYLTIEERERIYATNLRRHPQLEAQRDIFVFQCLVGCRVGDLVHFKKGDVVDGVLSYIPRKTKEGNPVVVRVPLTETAREIVARYADFQGDRLLPFISTQKYNDALKRIFTAARVTRLVSVLDPLTREEVKRPLNEVASSHLARRTFIGNLYKQVRDPNLIGAMSGHAEGSRAFARYRTIDDEIKAGVVDLLESDIKKRESGK